MGELTFFKNGTGELTLEVRMQEQSSDANPKMTQLLELPDQDFKSTIVIC